MVPGEVLVASITTPAWTSLFAMASGWSPTSADRSATVLLSRANMASRRCSIRRWQPDASTAGNRSGWTATPARLLSLISGPPVQ